MEEIRCGVCSRKLGEGVFTRLVIKCPRCGAINTLRAESPPSARQGAPDLKGPHGSNHSLDRRQTPLQQQSFGGKVAGQTFGTATTAPAINLLRIEENLSAAHLRLASGTYIENLDWAACIDRYDRAHTLFYLDPPYWETEGYGVPFAWEQYELMAAKLKAIKGKAVVSINDHPAIRECFAGFDMEALKLDYTVGGGANRVERGELVIYSWDREAEPAGLF